MGVLAAAAEPTGFWAEYKDLLALVVSLLALAVSVVTSRQNLKATREIARESAENGRRLAQESHENSRRLAQAATYQRIHETLVDPKAAAGRRRLFQAKTSGTYPRLGEEGWDEINYSLALYDTLGGYVRQDQVDAETVLTAWHHPLHNIADAVDEFMAHREEQNVSQPWAHLRYLLTMAKAHRCRCDELTPASTPP